MASKQRRFSTPPGSEESLASQEVLTSEGSNQEQHQLTERSRSKQAGWGLTGDSPSSPTKLSRSGRRRDTELTVESKDREAEENTLERKDSVTKERRNSRGSRGSKQSITVLNDDLGDTAAVIPELGNAEGERATVQVAAAPSNKMNRILALQELDRELETSNSSPMLYNDDIHGLDLSILTSTLNHPEELYEDDRHWDWSILFTQVASDIQNDIEANEMVTRKGGVHGSGNSLQKSLLSSNGDDISGKPPPENGRRAIETK